jgi:hypothetical protein
VAVLVPLVMLALTIAMGEFLAARRTHASVTDATSTALYFFLDGVQVGPGWCEGRRAVGRWFWWW